MDDVPTTTGQAPHTPQLDTRRPLPNSRQCFVCGEENPSGLHARFYVEDDAVVMPLAVNPDHCGFPNTVHGGVIAAALDECMGWAAARAIERMCVTGELTVRYVQPVPADGTMMVRAWVVKAHRRLAQVKGEIVDEAGSVYVRGEARFVPLTAEQTLRVDDALLYRGNEERIFERLRSDNASTQ